MQSPIREYNGRLSAEAYRDIGINTFIGLWEWPSEENMGAGYNLYAANTLKQYGLKAYAGNNLDAVNWLKSHPEFANTFIGYFLGDEPDMFKVNGDPSMQPDEWKSRGNILRKADPSRMLNANFGKGFALDPWPGYRPTTTQAEDFAKYVAPTTAISSDFYAITDPFAPLNQHGIWGYGRAVSNTLKYAGSRPVWGVVETSGPWRPTQGSDANRKYAKMPPSLIMPAVWMMIVHGARGITYFCHDFTNPAYADGCLREPGMPEAVKAANESVLQYADIILTPTISGIVSTTDGSVNVTILAKRYQGFTYIYAMSDGNTNYPDGNAVDAVISDIGSGSGTKTVEVLNEGRNVSMQNGQIGDHFEAYDLHIYRYK